MNPTWTSDCGRVQLYLGDCLEILPNIESVSAVVTDPPYCSGGFSESGRKNAKGMGLRSETIREVGWFINDRMTTAGIAWLMRAIAGWCFRIMPDGGSMVAFTDWRMLGNLSPAIESSGLRYQNLVVWKKPSAGLGTGFRAQHELAMHFVKGTGIYHSASVGNVIECGRVSSADRQHQTEKPEELIVEIASVVSGRGDIVLDPFMGSGTTAIACIRTGRRFIGIEIEPRYFEIAKERIQRELAQPFLIAPEQPKMMQEELCRE